MTLKEWLSKSITRPHKIVAVFLLAVWSVFAVRSYLTIESKQHTYVKQTADLLSIAFHQQNRVIAESGLETLLSQGGAISAEVCNGDKQEISANQDLRGCLTETEIYERLVEQKIPGSSSLVLRARFNLITDMSSVLSALGLALILVFCGFYVIQTAQNRIKKDLFDPLFNKLLGNDQLEIQELMDLRSTIHEAKELEAHKAVTLAIQENNQQVAHDIRSPVESINALLKMIEIRDPDLRAALDKAVHRANSVANFLLKPEQKTAAIGKTTLDFTAIIQDIAIEKRPLFIDGQISAQSPKFLVGKSSLPAESLSRILSNVVDNAIQACDHDRRVKIKLSQNDEFVEIAVQDSGRGISEELLNRIGEKGLSQRPSSQPVGTGRGVYSAKKTLEEVGGSIQFSSLAGLGTTVLLKTPVAAVECLDKLDLVLIENEEMHRLTWKVWAKRKGLGILTFTSADDFLLRAGRLSKSTPIFVDFDLDDNMTAQNYLPGLRRLGFSEIVLVTSHRDLKKEDFFGTKAIIGKDPEFAERFLPRPELNSAGTAIHLT
jgi:signal transduction histidine kinase